MTESFSIALATSAVGAFFGTVAGALSASYIERKRREAERIDANLTAANTVIHHLAQFYDRNYDIRRDLIDPVRERPDRWLTLRPTLVPPPVSVDSGTLAFMFRGSTADVPSAVALELIRYDSLRQILDRIARLHVEEAQPRMERRGLIGTTSLSDAEQACGVRVVETLRGLVDDLIRNVDENLASVPATAMRVANATEEIYPGKRAMRIAVPGSPVAPIAPAPWYMRRPTRRN